MLGIIRFLFLFLWLITSTGMGFIFCLGRPFHPDNLRIVGRFFGYFGTKIMGLDYEVRGKEKLDSHRPCVFISNHQNNIDLIVGGMTIPKRTVTLGKISLVRIPIFGQFYWLSGNILINRRNKRKARESMSKVTDSIVNKNTSVWIFPEGTRSRGRGLIPFKSGAFRTAVDAQVPIVPICFNSYHRSANFNKIKSGKIVAQILDPIDTKGLGKEDIPRLAGEAFDKMKATIEKLDSELESHS